MPAALLVHGLSASPASMWRFRAWLEAAGWSVTDRSPLGHGGRGPAPGYAISAQVTDVLTTGPWDLVVGHSLGGTIATVAAGRAGWTGRLVLVDPAWYLSPELQAEVRPGELAELDLTRERLELEHPDWDPRDVAAKLAGIAGAERDAVAGAFDDNPVWDVRAEALALPVPTLLLTGDPAVFTLLDPVDAVRAVAANPRVTWSAVPGAGHAPHRDRPAETQERLLDWLQGV
jgi:pimeloyl-ACP methyl ester carboxylesterase